MPGEIRKIVQFVEDSLIEGGKKAEKPTRMVAVAAVVRNPWAGRGYVENLRPEILDVAPDIARQIVPMLVEACGGADKVEAYGKAAIVGVDGELEHGAVWHEAGGWAMRSVLGEPKAIVPASKAVASAGYRIMMPLHYVHACYVRSHFNGVEVGIQDAPRPREILYALAMGSGGRVHSRLGGLLKENVSVHDGQR